MDRFFFESKERNSKHCHRYRFIYFVVEGINAEFFEIVWLPVSDSDNSSGSETLGSSDSDTSETSDTSSSDSDFETPKKKRKLTDSHPKSSGIYQGRRILDYDELDVVTKEVWF